MRSLLLLPFVHLVASGGTGKSKGGVVLADVLPPTRYGLSPCIEFDAIWSVDVQVAKERAIPTPEGVVGDRHGNRDIDANHSGRNLGLETLRQSAVTGEDGGAIAVAIAFDQPESIVERVHANQAENRAEDLVGVDPHVRHDLVNETRSKPVTSGRAVDIVAAPIDCDLRAFCLTDPEVGSHLLTVLRSDERSHLGVVFIARTNRESGDARLDS